MKSNKVAHILFNILIYSICGIMFLVIAVPLYISIMGGFKSVGQLKMFPLGIPDPFLVNQYVNLLTGKQGSFWLELGNSLLVGVGTVAVVIVVGTLAAYALARIHFRFNSAI